jgi:hypothetical protein
MHVPLWRQTSGLHTPKECLGIDLGWPWVGPQGAHSASDLKKNVGLALGQGWGRRSQEYFRNVII